MKILSLSLWLCIKTVAFSTSLSVPVSFKVNTNLPDRVLVFTARE